MSLGVGRKTENSGKHVFPLLHLRSPSQSSDFCPFRNASYPIRVRGSAYLQSISLPIRQFLLLYFLHRFFQRKVSRSYQFSFDVVNRFFIFQTFWHQQLQNFSVKYELCHSFVRVYGLLDLFCDILLR